MANSYPAKIGTKLGDCAGPNYRPDGRVHPGHLTGLQNPMWRRSLSIVGQHDVGSQNVRAK
jgi:hypothetical protein